VPACWLLQPYIRAAVWVRLRRGKCMRCMRRQQQQGVRSKAQPMPSTAMVSTVHKHTRGEVADCSGNKAQVSKTFSFAAHFLSCCPDRQRCEALTRGPRFEALQPLDCHLACSMVQARLICRNSGVRRPHASMLPRQMRAGDWCCIRYTEYTLLPGSQLKADEGQA
jgi:hypothetical protein